MTLRRGKKKTNSSSKTDKGVTAKPSREAVKKAVLSVADKSESKVDIYKKLQKQGISVTTPTISKYLKEHWKDDYKENLKKMTERRRLRRKWEEDFNSKRIEIDKAFKKDYLTNTDGLWYDPKTNKLISPPPMAEIAKMNKEQRKNFITFSKDGEFGYIPNKEDPDKIGTVDLSIKYIIKKQLMKRIENIRNIEIHELREKEIQKELKTIKSSLSKAEKEKMEKKIRRQVRKEFKKSEQAKKIRDKYETKTKDALDYVDNMKTDDRSKTLLKLDLLSRNLDPAYASSSKTSRGRTRMVAEEDNPFSRATHNIPYIEWAHPKRIQVHAAQLSKRKAKLINSEKPIVKAKYNDINGVNLVTRMPKNWMEDLNTRDGAIIISNKAAEKMRYFRPVENGTFMIDDINKQIPTIKVPKKINTYEDYKKYNIDDALDVERGDPIMLNGIDQTAIKAADTFAKHTGKIVLIGEPKKKKRTITIETERDPMGREKIVIEYYRQDYQIVRADKLRVGDKVISRTGVKSIIADIRDDLGKDKKGRPIEVIVNYDDVWRQSEDPEKDDIYFKQGKKKAHMVLEHQNGEGKMFFHLINKFSADQGGEGLRISTTLLSGLWEATYSEVIKKPNYTQRDLDIAMQSFIEKYFGTTSSLIDNMKALHYRFVQDGDKINIEIDPNEPTPDSRGEIIPFYHVANGHKYKYAYLPNKMAARVYSDGKTLRERFKIESENEVESSRHWYQLTKIIRNSMYIFPTIDNAIDLVAVPYVNKKDPTDTNTVIMDASDIIRIGENPYNPELKVTWRKEPVTNMKSIQTVKVIPDFSGKYQGTIAINSAAAIAATLDYDGDQVSVFQPALDITKLKLSKEQIDEIEDIKKIDYKQKQFDKLYPKAIHTKYAKNLDELAVQTAQYNTNIAATESTLIRQYGGIKRASLLLFGAIRPEKVIIGSGKNKREFEITPDLVNQVTDVEKILKLKEPYWKLKKLYKTPWKDLTEEERDLAQDYYIRRAIKRQIKEITNTSEGKKMRGILSAEKSYMGEEGSPIYRGFDPRGLIIDTKSNKLIDNILLHMIKISDTPVFEKEGQEQ